MGLIADIVVGAAGSAANAALNISPGLAVVRASLTPVPLLIAGVTAIILKVFFLLSHALRVFAHARMYSTCYRLATRSRMWDRSSFVMRRHASSDRATNACAIARCSAMSIVVFRLVWRCNTLPWHVVSAWPDHG
jgi:hypothetical protein